MEITLAVIVSVVTALLGTAVGYGILKQKVESLGNDVEHIKALNLDARLAKIDSDLEWIKMNIAK